MKQVKFNIAFLAILLGAGIVFTQVAFKAPVQQKKGELFFDYAYNGTDFGHVFYADYYTKLTHHGDDPVCSGVNYPCVISVSGDLQTYLDAHTEMQILNDAIATKN